MLVSVHVYCILNLGGSCFTRWIRNSIPALRCLGLINDDRKLSFLLTPHLYVTNCFRRHGNIINRFTWTRKKAFPKKFLPCDSPNNTCRNATTAALNTLTYLQQCQDTFGLFLRVGADTSLDRHTPRRRRTEWIVSLERSVCSCAELQDFSCYRGWKEA